MLTINDTLDGFLNKLEILGNTIQDIEQVGNLADIRSVGDKVEGQELYKIDVASRGKNLFNLNKVVDLHNDIQLKDDIITLDSKVRDITSITKFKPNIEYTLTYNRKVISGSGAIGFRVHYTDGSNEYLVGSSTLGFLNFTFGKNKTVSRFEFTFSNTCTCELSNIQIEEGITVTPYEPYQEDKLTILSPTPLEKVGNVADRIICKDGVYGVEKNIKTFIIDGSDSTLLVDNGGCTDNTLFLKGHSNDAKLKQLCIANYRAFSNMWNFYKKDVEGVTIGEADVGYGGNCYCITISKSKASNLSETRNYLKNNPVLVKYQLAQPTFIPLPHDQQIKLRTFADRTHISFKTEIEPTIKASVPKSLGATVNTHTSQIDNLNKELDRVKKLEESTVSTVTSYKAFTTIAETNGGYLEDVKVEGRTLVNLANKNNLGMGDAGNGYFCIQESYCVGFSARVKPNTTYTIIRSINSNRYHICGFENEPVPDNGIYATYQYTKFNSNATTLNNIITINTTSETNYIQVYLSNNYEEVDCLILEGDHTDKDLNFFEGLKSVGQGTDEIEILSHNKNYFNGKSRYEESNNTITDITSCVVGLIGKTTRKITFKADITTINHKGIEGTNSHWGLDINFMFTDGTTKWSDFTKGRGLNGLGENDTKRKFIWVLDFGEEKTIQSMSGCMIFTRSSTGTFIMENIEIILGEDTSTQYVPYSLNKKEILYYNPTTQTWEKPILREWDSIEKHDDGKYYYHKRSGEVVLNGGENWVLSSFPPNDSTLIRFDMKLNSVKVNTPVICDKFVNDTRLAIESIRSHDVSNMFNIIILKTKLSTQDVAGFKAWLQANPVTVVYQLAQEEVYECTNLDLITYNEETNLIVNSGAIQPKLELKVLSNVSNVVKLLQEKVSILESDISKYMISQNRSQLDATYKSDSVTFKIDYVNSSKNMTNDYSEDLYNLILDNILVGKNNYNYNHMFNLVMDYASWNKITWEQFDGLVLLMDLQHNPIEELPEELN